MVNLTKKSFGKEENIHHFILKLYTPMILLFSKIEFVTASSANKDMPRLCRRWRCGFGPLTSAVIEVTLSNNGPVLAFVLATRIGLEERIESPLKIASTVASSPRKLSLRVCCRGDVFLLPFVSFLMIVHTCSPFFVS